MGDIVHMRGEGGSVIPMELPFPEHIADRVAKGHIVRVHPDGSPWTDDPAPAAGPEVAEGHDGGPTRPKPAEAKATWVAYAETLGMPHDEADAMTKADLIKRFG